MTSHPAMSIQDQVRRELAEFTDAESRVARALLGEYPMAGMETVARLARRAKTSGPTILRFVARLGFDNYAAFQDAIRSEIQARLQSPLVRYDSIATKNAEADTSDRVAQALRQNIEIAAQDLRKDIGRITALLTDLDRTVLCLGGRFSGMIAAYLHQYMRELRPGVRLVRDGPAAWADYLLDVREGDILVVFDFRRYQRDVAEFARSAAAQKAVIVLVTDIWYSPIAAISDVVVACPVSIPSAFDSGVTGLAMVELMTAGVVEALGSRSKARIATLEALRKPFNPSP